MKTCITPRRVAVGLAAAAAMLSLGGAATAATDTIYKYTTPKTGFLHLPAAAFTPTGPINAFSNNGIEILNGTNSSACFVAPVNLPNGATITGLNAWYTQSVVSGFNIEFARYKVADGSLSDLVSQNFATTGGVRKQAGFTITPVEVVNNTAYAYVMVVCMNATNDSFFGARIKYTYSNAGD